MQLSMHGRASIGAHCHAIATPFIFRGALFDCLGIRDSPPWTCLLLLESSRQWLGVTNSVAAIREGGSEGRAIRLDCRGSAR